MLQFRYLGFDQLANARAYRFGVISRTEDDRKFVVTVDLALFRKHGVAIQEGPSLCARKLAADLEQSVEGISHELTADDLKLFAQDRADAEARKVEARSAGGRRPKPPVTNAASAWTHMRRQETDMPFQGDRKSVV